MRFNSIDSLFCVIYPPGGGGNFISSRLNNFFLYSDDSGDLLPNNEYHKNANPFLSIFHPEDFFDVDRGNFVITVSRYKQLYQEQFVGRRVIIVKPGAYGEYILKVASAKNQIAMRDSLNTSRFCKKENKHYDFMIATLRKHGVDVLVVDYGDLFVNNVVNTLRNIVTWMGCPPGSHAKRTKIMGYKFEIYHKENIKLLDKNGIDARITNIVND